MNFEISAILESTRVTQSERSKWNLTFRLTLRVIEAMFHNKRLINPDYREFEFQHATFVA